MRCNLDPGIIVTVAIDLAPLRIGGSHGETPEAGHVDDEVGTVNVNKAKSTRAMLTDKVNLIKLQSKGS